MILRNELTGEKPESQVSNRKAKGKNVWARTKENAQKRKEEEKEKKREQSAEKAKKVL